MHKLEVFFDYVCPYCLKGHQYLKELLPGHPGVEAVWRPCESHPRPERYGRHTELCIQGMYFAADCGIDLWAYHDRVFELIHERGVNVEIAGTLAQNLADILDAEALREALKSGRYRKIQKDGNAYAFEESGVWVVPAYRMDGRRLDSIEGVGVSREQLRAFMEGSAG